MSKIKIYSKKAFAFGEGANRNGEVDMFVTVPNAFQEMPEKYTTDPTYRLAVVCGDVIPYPNTPVVPVSPVSNNDTDVVTTNEDEVQESNGDEGSPTDEVSAEAVIEEFYETLKIANKHDTQKYAKQYGAEFIETDSLKENKKRVMEAFKLSLSK